MIIKSTGQAEWENDPFRLTQCKPLQCGLLRQEDVPGFTV